MCSIGAPRRYGGTTCQQTARGKQSNQVSDFQLTSSFLPHDLPLRRHSTTTPFISFGTPILPIRDIRGQKLRLASFIRVHSPFLSTSAVPSIEEPRAMPNLDSESTTRSSKPRNP